MFVLLGQCQTVAATTSSEYCCMVLWDITRILLCTRRIPREQVRKSDIRGGNEIQTGVLHTQDSQNTEISTSTSCLQLVTHRWSTHPDTFRYVLLSTGWGSGRFKMVLQGVSLMPDFLYALSYKYKETHSFSSSVSIHKIIPAHPVPHKMNFWSWFSLCTP